jgi:hypothetical protein
METKEIEFAKLRHAYITIKHFLETEGYEKVTSLDNKVEADLGLSGDDNYELLEKFVTKFELDHKSFDYDKHFYSEDEIFGVGRAVVNLLTLSVWLPLKTIELLTFNKIDLDKPKFPVTPDREVSDLTFKDLLTWYIEKEYVASDKIKYQVKKTSAET